MSTKIIKKGILHPRNLHNGSYDFDLLTEKCPSLTKYIIKTPRGQKSINFSDPKAILELNSALLNVFYNINFWKIPEGYLCPPIPGRSDYIHYAADLLAQNNEGLIPKGKKVKVLDIGTGANCIYPILGIQSYGWSFVGTDISEKAIKHANLIVQSNKNLNRKIKLRVQKNTGSIFQGIINKKDYFDLTICNPPFHASIEQANLGSRRKINNLAKEKVETDAKISLNFGGQENELCCNGGEIAFLKQMVRESQEFSKQVGWFSSLVSKNENIAHLKKLLARLGSKEVETIKMCQGQKVSRFIAWRF